MDRTQFLGLPFLQASQSQKHLTHNEALKRLDTCVQISVASRTAAPMPPASPSEGARYIVPVAAQGAWSEQDGAIATYLDGEWVFAGPAAGWLVWVEDEARLLVHDGSAFGPAHGVRLENLERLGVNAQPDATNPLAVSGPGSLFTHAGADHRLSLNKAAPGDTASVVFQTGYSGRAEFGLAGDDDWHVKVSADGASWREALTASAASGEVKAPHGLRLGTGGSLLDVYEDGPWTPELVGATVPGTPTYLANSGNYIRIGALVHVTGRVAWSSLGGLSGSASIAGLPYPCRDGLNNRTPMVTAWYNSVSMGPDTTLLGGFTEPGTDRIRLWGANQAHEGTNLLLTDAHLTDAAEIYFSCTFKTV